MLLAILEALVTMSSVCQNASNFGVLSIDCPRMRLLLLVQ